MTEGKIWIDKTFASSYSNITSFVKQSFSHISSSLQGLTFIGLGIQVLNDCMIYSYKSLIQQISLSKTSGTF